MADDTDKSSPVSSTSILTTRSPTAGSGPLLSGPRRDRATSLTSRKRRVPDTITPNACTNCRRARAKVLLFRSLLYARRPAYSLLSIVQWRNTGLQKACTVELSIPLPLRPNHLLFAFQANHRSYLLRSILRVELEVLDSVTLTPKPL